MTKPTINKLSIIFLQSINDNLKCFICIFDLFKVEKTMAEYDEVDDDDRKVRIKMRTVVAAIIVSAVLDAALDIGRVEVREELKVSTLGHSAQLRVTGHSSIVQSTSSHGHTASTRHLT